ncbi:MAG: DUF3667 domain-containing protein [Croceibacterium sp.]
MSELGEAMGGAVEGGLYARAVEPDAGIARKGHFQETACLNCGTELIGNHCHACGQKAHVHRTLAAFMHDLLHGALHFEGKIWHTLPMLAFRPGKLTRRYIDGQRARYVSPMALFLFGVFLMFATFQLAGISAPDDLGPPVEIDGDIAAASAEAVEKSRLEELRKARAGLADTNPGAAILDAQIESLESKPAGDEVRTQLSDSGYVSVKKGKTGVALIDGLVDKWRANPSLMAYKLQTNSYKFSWLLIPLSIPFVWLLFAWRRRFKAYDHAIFVTYSLSFMTLFAIALTLLGLVGLSGGAIFMAFAVLAPMHIYKQLRGAYELPRFSAAWRLIVLLFFIIVILTLFLQVLVLVGLF